MFLYLVALSVDIDIEISAAYLVKVATATLELGRNSYLNSNHRLQEIFQHKTPCKTANSLFYTSVFVQIKQTYNVSLVYLCRDSVN